MGKHKKAHRTYPDSGKKHEKNRPQVTPCQTIKTNQPGEMNQPSGMNEEHSGLSADMLSKMTAEPSSARRLITAESVRAGHPDKLCDQIADAILDEYLQEDENARVAVEVMATQGRIIVAGEITSTAQVNIRRLVCNQLAAIGCGYENLTGSLDVPLEIDIRIHEQSPDIGNAVSHAPVYDEDGDICLADTLGAGDQGVMVGYATIETDEMMPLPSVLAHRICRLLDEAMEREPWLCSDGKAQVTVLYHGDVPVVVTDVVVSVQHLPGKDNRQIENFVTGILTKAIPACYWTSKTQVHVNPSGRFVRGGPAADTGLTGRKLAVDAYGASAHIGGGAMSGKDPTKVDRTGAYAARWVAKNIVAAGLADCCEVQIAYGIGMTDPVSVLVETYGSGKVPADVLDKAVRRVFDLRPGALIDRLHLRETRYAPLAAYGHFGRSDGLYAWEATDRSAELLNAVLGDDTRMYRTKHRRRMNNRA